MLSAADQAGPACVATVPAGKGPTCWLSATSTCETMSRKPPLIMPRASSPSFLRGLKHRDEGATPPVLSVGEQLRSAEQARCSMSCPQAWARVPVRCHRQSKSRDWAYASPVASRTGRASHVGTQQNSWSRATAQHPTTPVPPDASVHLVAGPLQPLRDQLSGAPLLMRQHRMLMQIAVQVLLPGTHSGLAGEDLGHRGVRRDGGLLLVTGPSCCRPRS